MIYDMHEIIERLARGAAWDTDIEMLHDMSQFMVKGLEYDPSQCNVCIDFDSTIHDYEFGWTGAADIPGLPLPGAIEFIQKCLVANITVTIFSVRCNWLVGIEAMRKWLELYGIEEGAVSFQPGKPPFHVLIDDHNIPFNGDWDQVGIEQVAKFKSWNQK